MPKILVIGATGFLGNALCAALLRAGHTVYGLARNPAKAKSLIVQEILPVMGSVQESGEYLTLIREKNIDSVIDASGAMDGAFQLLKDLTQAGKERLEMAQRDGLAAQKLGFVYTSGMWAHGNSVEQIGDLDPVGVASAKNAPATLVGWRPQLERDILATKDVLDVAVLRPALMYGKTSPIWAFLLGPVLGGTQAKEGRQQQLTTTVTVQADPDCMSPTIHVDDIALAYVRAVEKVHLLAGTGIVPIFDVQTAWENVRVLLETFARVVGFTGKIEYAEVGENAFAQAMSTSVKGDSSRARQILGWEPTRPEGFVAGMEVYARAFAAGMS